MRRDKDGFIRPASFGTPKRRINWDVVLFWACVTVLSVAQAGFAIYGALVWWSGVCQ